MIVAFRPPGDCRKRVPIRETVFQHGYVVPSGFKEGIEMKYYFLALATAVVVCVGCAYDGQQIIDRGEYNAPPASMMQWSALRFSVW